MAECYIVNPIDFSQTQSYMLNSSLTGAPGDSPSGMLSVWLEIDPNGTTQYIYRHSDASQGDVHVRLLSGGDISVLFLQPGVGNTIVSYNTGSVFSDGWHHYLFAWDLVAPTPVFQCYVDDLDDMGTFGVGPLAGNVDMTPAASANIGCFLTNGSLPWIGCMAELWLHHADYLDISVESNRRLFRDELGFPVDLGSDGSTPTGNAPLVYLKTASPNFHLNSGIGTDWTQANNQLVCPVTPSLPRPPDIIVEFIPPSAGAGDTVTKVITIDNECNTENLTGIGFTDTLPEGLIVANPANTVNTCGGTLTANPGGSEITLSGATLTAGET